MSRRHGTSAVIVVSALIILGCGEDRTPLPVEGPPPSLSTQPSGEADNLTGTACPEGGPDFPAKVVPEFDGCIIGGFADQNAEWQMLVYPVRTGPGVMIWATIEHRESPTGYGVRFLDAVEWTEELDEDTTNVFTLRYIKELSGSIIMGYAASCPATYAENLQECWNNRDGAHHEIQLCIPNDTTDPAWMECSVGAPNYEASSSLNLLPVAAIGSIDRIAASEACATYRFSAAGSKDPDGEDRFGNDIAYTWSFEPGTSVTSNGKVVERQFCQAGEHRARLLVADTAGGLDLADTLFAVVLGGAPPLPPVESVTVSPESASVLVGHTVQLSAELRDASGTLLTDRSVTWESSNAAIAEVSPTGTVSGVAAGSATIQATSGGRSGMATVTVTAPPPPSALVLLAFEVPQPASGKQSCDHRVQVSGGVPPYSYHWLLDGSGPVGDPTSSAFSYTNTGVDYQVGVSVYDAVGQLVRAKTLVTVVRTGATCPSPTPI